MKEGRDSLRTASARGLGARFKGFSEAWRPNIAFGSPAVRIPNLASKSVLLFPAFHGFLVPPGPNHRSQPNGSETG